MKRSTWSPSCLDPGDRLERLLERLVGVVGERHPLGRDARGVEGAVHLGHRAAVRALAHERQDAVRAALDAERRGSEAGAKSRWQRSGVKYFSILRSLDQRIFTPFSIRASAKRSAYFGDSTSHER